RAPKEKLHGQVVNALGILLQVRLLGQYPALRKDIAYGAGNSLKALTRTRYLRVDHSVKNEMPFVERIFCSHKRNRPTTILVHKPRNKCCTILDGQSS